MIKIGMAIWLIWMSVLDVKSCSVPRKLLLVGGGLVLGLAVLVLFWEPKEFEVREALVACAAGAMPGFCLLVVSYVTKAVGYGDGVVMVVLGIVSGARKGLLMLAVALFLIAVFSVVLLFLHKVQRNSRLPFLPFLTAGWFLVGIG